MNVREYVRMLLFLTFQFFHFRLGSCWPLCVLQIIFICSLTY